MGSDGMGWDGMYWMEDEMLSADLDGDRRKDRW